MSPCEKKVYALTENTDMLKEKMSVNKETTMKRENLCSLKFPLFSCNTPLVARVILTLKK